MSLVAFSTVTATAVVRPTVIEFAMLYDVDGGAGRYVAAEQLSGQRTAVYATQAELLPERIVLDEWGYPVVLGPVSPALQALAREAADACPRRALHLRPA